MENIKEKKLKEKIGLNLFRIRRSRELRLHKLSKLLKMPESRLDNLERGNGCMNVANLEKMADFYDINIGDLFR